MVVKADARSVYLVDASCYIFRAYFALPDAWLSPQGMSVNAVFGYTRFLLQFLKNIRPQFVAAAFDESLETGFRHYLYPLYKSNRALADEALSYQLQQCQRVTRLLGIQSYASPVFEADDLLATLVRLIETRGQHAVLMSHDKDLAQLIHHEHQWWDVAKERVLDERGVEQLFGVKPAQIPDYLALVGDASDCIPGVEGVGPKTAAMLLSEFENVIELAKQVDKLKVRQFRGKQELCEVLEQRPYDVMLSRELATVWDKANEVNRRHTLEHRQPNVSALRDFFEEMGFGSAIHTQLKDWVETIS